jgi:DNA repair protein RadD
MAKELRPYQDEALRAIRETVGQGCKRLVCQAPTGSGKTLVAAAIANGALSRGNRMAFVVSSLSLIDQTVQMFWDEGIRDVGVIQADHQLTDWSKPLQVCSIQTIHSRGLYPEAKVVVIDEVHQLHKEHIKWIGRLAAKEGEPPIVDAAPGWERVPIIGLSATPWTRGLGRYFESLLVMSTTAELIELGYLSKFKVYAADHPNLSGVKTVAGDYHEGQLSSVMQEQGLVANVIETWRLRWGKDKTLLFAVDCAHAQMLQARFNEAGIPCAYQDAHTSSADRAEIKRGFHNGTYKVVANVGTLTTGVDWDVRCLSLARPTKSEMLFVQIIGRALRTAPGKDHALILDHTDTTARLGFVTDIHHEQLLGGKMDQNKASPRSPPLPKPCPVCAYLIPVGCKKCPECGHERKVESGVYERDGQLVELSFDGRRKGRTDPKRFHYSYAEKRQFFLQLRAYQLTKPHWKPGWAAVQYREKFDEGWPPWSWNALPPADGVGTEVKQWLRSRFIAWAQQNERAKAEQDRSATGAPGAAGVATNSARTGGSDTESGAAV